MPLTQVAATEDQLAVGKSFSSKEQALSVSAAVNDRLVRRMCTHITNRTEIHQKCVEETCEGSIRITLKLKTGEYLAEGTDESRVKH